MSRRAVFTTITPLPAGVTRQIVLDFLHAHEDMIDLNPLVKERHPIPTPPHAKPDEQSCQWYSLTDKISYLPGVSGDITYTCAFYDLPNGLKTHCYAPAGVTIRDRWTVGGALPGEPAEPVEPGLQAPSTGLYLREDVELRSNVIMASFVKKTLKKSHAALVDRLKIKAQIAGASRNRRTSSNSAIAFEPSNVALSGKDGTNRISSQHHYHSSACTTPSRPSSAASSVDSATSSPSCYSLQSTPSWPETSALSSSLTTSRTPSANSSSTTHSNNYQTKSQHQPRTHTTQVGQALTTAEPETRSEPAYIPLQPPEPETPFLRQQQPDWPLKSSASSAQTARPRSQSVTYTVTPPLCSTAGGQTQRYQLYKAPEEPRPANANLHVAASSSTALSALSDDALWLALGGRGSMAQNKASHKMNGALRLRSHSEGHPDYPQMSPYDDDKVGELVGVGTVKARPVSLSMVPAPLRPRGPVAATLSGPWTDEFY
ncbi:hypothetical protein VTI74DRAFT_6014 [Chaetomium olivicolor]